MKVIDTSTIKPGQFTAWMQHQVYNGLDCCLTVEILQAIKPYLGGSNAGDINFDPVPALKGWGKLDKEKRAFYLSSARQLTYQFERAMQGPALEMMQRGWRVDLFWRDEAVAKLKKDQDKLQRQLDSISAAIWGKGLNPNSPPQLKSFFYEVMRLPEQFKFEKGQKKVTTNREALEKLHAYFYARPTINHILALRDTKKKISVLETEVDSDKRMRTSYNVTGTESGRWSSSANAFGGGTNLQNITEELRRPFIADPGWKLAYIDLRQAESRAVGWLLWILFGDATYLDACESSDLHTYVCKLVWPQLPWTGEEKADKAIAEQKFYRDMSYRDLGKRGGHGTNYYGKPYTMARHLHVAAALIEKFQSGYFSAFPGLRRWHTWTAEHIQLYQYLITPLGTGRHFFGRPNDDSTLREGIAHIPQSMVAYLLNLALWRIWKKERRVQLLAQIHDAVVVQYREEEEREVLSSCLSLMATPLSHSGRTMIIPSDISVGWNWKKFNKKKPTENPDGLIEWTGSDARKRSESPSLTGLDRRAQSV